MEEKMYLLMAKMLSNEATGEERRELDAWLAAAEENRAIFKEVNDLWQKTDTVLQQPLQFAVEPAWEKVFARTMNLPEKEVEIRTKMRPRRMWWNVGAAAAGLLIIVLLYNFLSGTDMVSAIASDKEMAIVLPDHSKVTLKPGSTLIYPEKFKGDERKITLTGEAFFEVSHNEKQPFIVKAQSAEVKVLGTSFFVSCTDSNASVAVSTGKVQMSLSKSPQQKVILTRGTKGVYQNETLATVTDTNYHYYHTGELIFNNQTFEQAIEIIGQVKNASILLDKSLDDADRQQKINISFKNRTIIQMLDDLCLITNTRWKKENNRYVIYTR